MNKLITAFHKCTKGYEIIKDKNISLKVEDIPAEMYYTYCLGIFAGVFVCGFSFMTGVFTYFLLHNSVLNLL